MPGFVGSPPASNRSTRSPGSSESRAASTQPADPAPTMTMSASVMRVPGRSIWSLPDFRLPAQPNRYTRRDKIFGSIVADRDCSTDPKRAGGERSVIG